MAGSLVRFWGVRGSVPAPLTSNDVGVKILKALEESRRTGSSLSFESYLDVISRRGPFTYGGNTSCVEVRSGNQIIVLDMGTGLRPLGNFLFPEMLKQGGLNVTFLLSHVHWDHIQGLPFFGPLYVNKETGIKNRWHFYGGTDWQKTAEVCLRGQMDPPTFPVSWREIQKTTEEMHFGDIYDRMELELPGGFTAKFRKLNHPQETYGVAILLPNGKVVVYSTDNEPYDPNMPDPRLVDLAKDADLWITDCQYTKSQYNGEMHEGGVPRHGWGHSYPEAVVATAMAANVKNVILFHHDPNSSDDRIKVIEENTGQLLVNNGYTSKKVQAAYEGLEIVLD